MSGPNMSGPNMSDGFWPDRVTGEINQITDRAAMGLPEHYVHPPLQVSGADMDEVRTGSLADLVTLVEDATAAPPRRIAAGWVLALAGDPRLQPLEPAMCRVAGGRATIGTDPADVDGLFERYARFGVQRPWIEKECPRFGVEVATFAIGKYPVTNGEFMAFLAETRYPELPTSWPYGRPPAHALNAPVYTVTAAAAEAYAAWLARKTGRAFRLPGEFEWEYAAAGADGLSFPWGNRFDSDAANTMETGLLCTSPVGAFPRGRTPAGVADLAGNVEEYVSDTYRPYPGGHLVADDLYLKLGAYRIARGGAFNRFSDLARCQRRHGAYPSSLYAIGFRLAEDIQ